MSEIQREFEVFMSMTYPGVKKGEQQWQHLNLAWQSCALVVTTHAKKNPTSVFANYDESKNYCTKELIKMFTNTSDIARKME